MGGVLEIGGAMLARAEQLTAASAQNLSNLTTPGYEAFRSFENYLSVDNDAPDAGSLAGRSDITPGKLVTTGNPLDLAISGSGYFLTRIGDVAALTRSAQLSRDQNGHLVTPDGGVLQTSQGDLVTDPGVIQVDADGTVSVNGKTQGQAAIETVPDSSALQSIGGSAFAAPLTGMSEVDRPNILQGAYEASNVSTSQEMTTIMSAMQEASAGQRVVQAYDDLMAQAINTFGQRSA